MFPWQEEYIANLKAIFEADNCYTGLSEGFDGWYRQQKEADILISTLRARNNEILSGELFPMLDSLYGADETVLCSLTEFASALMDWKQNLDCGVYVVIHDALLSLCRQKDDRKGIIRELYLLGMGLYYQRRGVEGINPEGDDYRYRNELVFTEAASYLPFFDDIDDTSTRGYIIRSLANIAICTRIPRKKIAASRRTLAVLTDEHFREAEPDLPWDSFLRGTHQQMSSNRAQLSRGDLSREDLAAVLDSCYEVFRPEENAGDPSIRWLWPYYEMEYNCGYADVKTTLDRIEELNGMVDPERFEVSDLYGLVQLPIYYGIILRDNPRFQRDPDRIKWLDGAYRRMEKALLSVPAARIDDYYHYLIMLVFTDYYETEGVPDYRSITGKLMVRLSAGNYLTSLKTAAACSVIAGAVLEADGNFFDDIPFISELKDPEEKKKVLEAFARDAALYSDFGLVKLNLNRIMMSRSLFESEDSMYCLHTVSGFRDLCSHPSTSIFADTALGHHCFYDGAGGYPSSYDRLSSPYRQMTDIVAAATRLAGSDRSIRESCAELSAMGGRELSPLPASCLSDEAVISRLEETLERGDEGFYRMVYDALTVS